MAFTILINTENAAFADNPVREVANILESLTARMDDSGYALLDAFDGIVLRDNNGNTVGFVAASGGLSDGR